MGANTRLGGGFDSGLAAEFESLARFTVVVNVRIAGAESLGLGFPDVPLYAMYRAVDYAAAAYECVSSGCEMPGKEEAMKHLGYADAMLTLAYVHASSAIGDYYESAYERLRKKVASVSLDDYSDDASDYSNGTINGLAEAERRFDWALSLFNGSFVDMDLEPVDAQALRLINSSKEERLKVIDASDEWVMASKGRYLALCKALPLLEDELTRKDQAIEKVSHALGVVEEVWDTGSDFLDGLERS